MVKRMTIVKKLEQESWIIHDILPDSLKFDF